MSAAVDAAVAELQTANTELIARQDEASILNTHLRDKGDEIALAQNRYDSARNQLMIAALEAE